LYSLSVVDRDQTDSLGRFACQICGIGFSSIRQLSGHRTGKHIRKLGLANAHISTEHLTDFQKGYLAAFLDGEGGIQLTRNFRRNREYKLALHPCVYFTNTNEVVIRQMRQWLGCGCVTRKRSENPRHKDTFALSITGTRNVLALLDVVRPYLIVKQRQADLLIEYCKSRLRHYRSGDRRFNKRELEIYTKLRRLNMKGGKIRRQRTDR